MKQPPREQPRCNHKDGAGQVCNRLLRGRGCANLWTWNGRRHIVRCRHHAREYFQGKGAYDPDYFTRERRGERKRNRSGKSQDLKRQRRLRRPGVS